MSDVHEALDCLPVIVWEATPDWVVTFTNSYALRFFGLDADRLTGLDWCSLIHPDDVAAMLAALVEAAARFRYRHEHRVRLADGSYRLVCGEALPLLDDEGTILRWYGVTREPTRAARVAARRAPEGADIYPITDDSGTVHLLAYRRYAQRPKESDARRDPRGGWYVIRWVS
jgi:PAS domain S-box-containing protein